MDNTKEIHDVKELNDITRAILKNMKDNCQLSSDLLNDGIEDELATRIREIIQDPFQSSINIYREAEALAGNFLEKYFDFTFSVIFKQVIEKLYKDVREKRDYFQYFVILKEDTISTRGLLNYFIFQYNRSDLRKRFPLIIQFIPSEFQGKLKHVKELSLDYDPTSSASTTQS